MICSPFFGNCRYIYLGSSISRSPDCSTCDGTHSDLCRAKSLVLSFVSMLFDDKERLRDSLQLYNSFLIHQRKIVAGINLIRLRLFKFEHVTEK